MRYCKYLSSENGATLSRYALVEKRNGVPWATLPMQAPQEDLSARVLGGLPVPTLAVDFVPVPLSDLKLLPPVTPSKILCVGRNYRDHAAELGNEIPKEPLLFLKPSSSLLAPRGIVRIPAISTRVDYEGELGIVIGRRCYKIGPDEDVRPYIRGYVCVNDVTARDIQKADGQWTRGKGFDTFCPVGPLVSDEVNPEAGLTVETRVNGELRQQGSTLDFLFAIPTLLSYITAAITLEPGDLLLTGTPAGVGPLAAGDRVDVSIDGLGVLSNTFTLEAK
jgi:2-keto-4-pentenoate hydratase/2-oxohepta-3-ene-1,7-dioic acid hydratase in catechol pathway